MTVAVLTAIGFTGDARAANQPASQAAAPKRKSSSISTGPQTVVPPTPQVHADRRVTFYFPDPGAHEVYLKTILPRRHLFAMKKDREGVWRVTIGPLQPGIYDYHFVADGIPLTDPSNPRMIPGLLWRSNSFEVPGPSPEPWDLQHVPHGVVHRQIYFSNVLDHWSDYYVYTPPGYDPRASRKYPVLYLMHGLADDARSWTAAGHANVILDNLIAQGKARPMIVVMPLSYGTLALLKTKRPIYLPKHFNPSDAMYRKNTRLFTKVLLDELIPRVQSEYRVLTGADSRAIAGSSMGGEESLLTGLNHIGKFAWIGSFSGALGDVQTKGFAQSFPSLDAASAAKLRLLWIAKGENECCDTMKRTQNFVAWLHSQDIPVTFVKTPGAHSTTAFSKDLVHFAPLLFRPESAPAQAYDAPSGSRHRAATGEKAPAKK